MYYLDTWTLKPYPYKTLIVTLIKAYLGLHPRYGYKDPISEEWTPGVFASIWQRYNNRCSAAKAPRFRRPSRV